MADDYICPFCGVHFAVTGDTYRGTQISFSRLRAGQTMQRDPIAIAISFYRCPSCENDTIVAKGITEAFAETVRIRPAYVCKHYPVYIPEQIRNNYEEACAIKDLSPKAAATLARRCLQGMIRNFWGIKRDRLYDEIDELRGKVDASLWEVIDKVRLIGNIGAHMEKDVDTIVDIDPDEADKLIQLIELLINDWYIARQRRQDLFTSIDEINDRIQEERKG